MKRVSGATDRMDQVRGFIAMQLGAEPADMSLHDVRSRIKVKVPDALQKHRSRHHFSGMPQKIFEKAELARLERDRPAAAANASAQQVHFQIPGTEDGFGGRGGRAA